MSLTSQILIIEDDAVVGQTIERCLQREGYSLRRAESGENGLSMARCQPPDLMILDVMMPGMDGLTLCRLVRADIDLRNVPIIMLTARSLDVDRVRGLQAGADDYITKPFNIDELLLRVRAILHRTHRQHVPYYQVVKPERVKDRPAHPRPSDHRVIRVGACALNTRTYEFSSPHVGTRRLTPIQFDLMHFLMAHAGEILSTARLLDEVWKYPADSGSADLVRVHIKKLREVVEPDPRHPRVIRTVSGYGYTVPAEEAQ